MARPLPLPPDPRLVVVKVGSAVLAPDGVVDGDTVARLAGAIGEQHAAGRSIVLVSSGAVASGYRRLGHQSMPTAIVDKQAAAAVGQLRLLERYASAFGAMGITIGQVLLTADDLEDRRRALNARHTIARLVSAGCVPVVNENDTVSFEEIRLGDNDRLSALVARLIGADLLVLLSSVDGLRADGGAGALIPVVADIEGARTHVADGTSGVGTGGMATKIDAMRIAATSGVAGVIADGRTPGVLGRVLAGEAIGTRFPAQGTTSARRFWIAHAARADGLLRVDDGAARALCRQGASLLPAGIVAVEGRFGIGAVVDVADAAGRVFARGMVGYEATEIVRIAGHPTSAIEARLGYRYADEVIHRDDLSLHPGVPSEECR